jgi:hypothetical protein
MQNIYIKFFINFYNSMVKVKQSDSKGFEQTFLQKYIEG